jgi:maleylacetate reductase
MTSFVHDMPQQRVVFASGSLARVGEEAERLGLSRVLVLATPGSGAPLAGKVAGLLGTRAVGVHAQAVVHVPKSVAQTGLAKARELKADGLLAVGGGAAIGLAKAIALETGLPIVALPTTYSGSEATPIYGTSEGSRKFTGSDVRVVPKTIVYDPDLTFGLPAAVSAASGMNAIAHCVENLWVPNRTPVTVAYAMEALRRFAVHLPRVVADGADREAREQCLIAAWLSGIVLCAGTALHHKLAHVLGGLGMPHAETHAIILPHVTRFNLPAAPEAANRLAAALDVRDGGEGLSALLRSLPIPQRLREVGFEQVKIDFVANEIAGMSVKVPRPAEAVDVRTLLSAAY